MFFLAIVSFYSSHKKEKMKLVLKLSFPWTKVVNYCIECGHSLTRSQLHCFVECGHYLTHSQLHYCVECGHYLTHSAGAGAWKSSTPTLLSVCVNTFHVMCIFEFTLWFYMLQCLFHFPDHSFIQFLDAKETPQCLLQPNLNTRTEELCWPRALGDQGGYAWCLQMA